MKSNEKLLEEISALSASVNPYAPKMTETQRRTAFLLSQTTGVILADVAEFFSVSVHTISMMKTHRHKYSSMKREYKDLGHAEFLNLYADTKILDSFMEFLQDKRNKIVAAKSDPAKASTRAGERHKRWITTLDAYAWPSYSPDFGWGYESSDSPGVVEAIEGFWGKTSQEAYDEITKYVG